MFTALLLTSCSREIASNVIAESPQAPKPVLIIIGEGGPSGSLFEKAADTYEKTTPWERYTVHSGDEFIAAMRDYVTEHGPIQHLEYFGHGNSVGLYINQAPNINGALYANDSRVNKDYIAASIYEMPRETFTPGGSIRFNGCNVAEWHRENTSNLAQNFSNYFQITADAPLGPTEFSQVPDKIKPYYNSGSLGKDFNGPVYLVPTDPERGFVLLQPQTLLNTYTDIYENTKLGDSVKILETKGWTPEKMGWTRSLEPWKNVTYWELLAMCHLFSETSSACTKITKNPPEVMVRNLLVLSTLIDVSWLPITTKTTRPWSQKYISYGMETNILTNDFIYKKWYTRAELLELAGNIIAKQGNI